MTKKRTVLFSICVLLVSLVVMSNAVFAWFTGGLTSIDNVVVDTIRMSIESRLYRLQDFNSDGVPDLDEEGLFPNPTEILNGMVSLDSMRPNYELSFLLRVRNLGSAVGKLSLAIKLDNNDFALADVLSFNYQHAELENKSKFFLDKNTVVVMGDADSDGNPLAERSVEVLSGSATPPYDIVFSIRFNSLEELKNQNFAKFGQMTDLNTYIAKTCKFTLSTELVQVVT